MNNNIIMKAILFILAFIPFLLLAQQETNNLRVKGNVVSDSVIVFNSTNLITLGYQSALRMDGNTTVWDDLMFPFTTGTNGGTGYPVFIADSMYYSFVVDTSGPSKCSMYFTIQVPHKAKLASKLYPHIHYKQEGSNTPIFVLKYKVYNINETTNKIYSNLVLSNRITLETDKTHGIVNGGYIQLSGNSISSIIVINIYLRTPASPNINCNAWQFDLHYEIDALGSNAEYIKN